MASPYTQPEFKSDAFNCPHCGAYAHQLWSEMCKGGYVVADFSVAECGRCQKPSLWHLDKMVYPSSGIAPLPNPDMPAEIKSDYAEARSISSLSPRGAAALLRLAIQKLCIHLGEKGDDLNTDIGNLVRKGLPATIQKALDVVRVIGNEAVHPGQIDLNDTPETARQLFGLVNLVTDAMVSQPKHVEELFQGLPEPKKRQISDRDKRQS